MVEHWSEKPCVVGSIPTLAALFMFKKIYSLFGLLFQYFVNGLLIIAPFFLTVFVISYITSFFRNIFVLGYSVYYVIFFFFFITFCGYFTRNFFLSTMYKIVEFFISRIPFISWIYSSVKDVTIGVVDKRVKFDKPVLVYINVLSKTSEDIKKIGFITNESAKGFDLLDEVVVFVPQPFGFSGELLLVPRKNLSLIDNYEGIDVYRFIATGGFFDIKKKENKKTDIKITPTSGVANKAKTTITDSKFF